ncbi:nitrous oxide-stimulated promoter family protein [Oryzomonas rubra]|uniref:Nitrous oxide-stimulated promoter family protein n=1 Tax=Oryzomonas rubra TaxID=2509454 RepID=A0A5A9X9T1_9BACT|nr:nitrous oxide-stimulated promoter family protein [Oryzomonas rubra]KAA0889817.1 nitrous oxide-stimulated promoter family protein [Oryzomonas rubra]
MMTIMEALTKQQKKDIRLIGRFVEVYCTGKHGAGGHSRFCLPEGVGEHTLCAECAEFMAYAVARRLKCPLEAEKPTCKRCRIHCYNEANRAKVKEIMAYSGKKLLLRGRLDYLWHYFF